MTVRTPPHRPARWSAWALALACLASAQAAASPPTKPLRTDANAAKPMAAHDPSAGAAEKASAKPEAPAERSPDAKAAPASVDPLETLRQRLAGTLSRQTLPDDGTGAYDLKVVARTQAVPAARSTARARSPGSATATPVASARAQAAVANWSYQGEGGPAAWASLHPDFRLCGSGLRQSPVDIRGGLAVDLEPVKFAYADARFGVIDTGRTVQAKVAAGSHIEIAGERFELQHIEFRRPSEERIDGRQFEMSAHLVHRDVQGRLAVVALLIDRGSAHPAVQTVWNNLPLEKGQESGARVPLELGALLPEDRRYYTYMGSLTTPPCSEDVRWVVMRQPVTMSAEQIDLFARIYPMNARPIQQLAGRRILQSQ